MIADSELSVLEVQIEDLFSYFQKDTTGIVSRILSNTYRYIELFYQVIFNGVMPESSGNKSGHQAYSTILNKQRMANLKEFDKNDQTNKYSRYPEKLFRN